MPYDRDDNLDPPPREPEHGVLPRDPHRFAHLGDGDTIFVLCDGCGAEGRIFRERHRPGREPEEVDCGQCRCCAGTGREEVPAAPIDMEDLDIMAGEIA